MNKALMLIKHRNSVVQAIKTTPGGAAAVSKRLGAMSAYELDFRSRFAHQRGDSSLLDFSKSLSSADFAAMQRGEKNEAKKHKQSVALGALAVGGAVVGGLAGVGGAASGASGAAAGFTAAEGSAIAAGMESAVGITPAVAGGTGAAAASNIGAKSASGTIAKSGIGISEAASGLSAASTLLGPKMPAMPAPELPGRVDMPKLPKQFETRASDLSRRATAAGALRGENDADLLGARPGVKRRGPARRTLLGY